MTGCPRLCDNGVVMARASASELPPGGNGTIRVMGLAGHACAAASDAAKPKAIAVKAVRGRKFDVFTAVSLWVCDAKGKEPRPTLGGRDPGPSGRLALRAAGDLIAHGLGDLRGRRRAA